MHQIVHCIKWVIQFCHMLRNKVEQFLQQQKRPSNLERLERAHSDQVLARFHQTHCAHIWQRPDKCRASGTSDRVF
jgi:hypothetical protein